MTDLPAEAVKRGVTVMCEDGWTCDFHEPTDTCGECGRLRKGTVERILTAAAPHIAAQATADLRAKIEALRFEVASIHHIHGTDCLCGFSSHVARARTEHILDALLPERAR